MHRRKIDEPARRFRGVIAWFSGALALMGFVWSGTAHAEAVECFVYDDGYANMAGPSDAILFRGPERDIWGQGKACIPDGGTGTCRKWFGRCRTTETHQPVLALGDRRFSQELGGSGGNRRDSVDPRAPP